MRLKSNTMEKSLNTYPLFVKALASLIKAFLISCLTTLPIIIVSYELGAQDQFNKYIPFMAHIAINAGLLLLSMKYLQMDFPDRSQFTFHLRHLPEALGLYVLLLGMLYFIKTYIPLPAIFQEEENMFLADLLTGNMLAVTIICLAGPIVEELIFRGVFQNYFLQKTTPLRSILYSSVLFALMHISPDKLLETFLAGLLLGYLHYKTKSLVLPILIHCLNNTMTALLMVYT